MAAVVHRECPSCLKERQPVILTRRPREARNLVEPQELISAEGRLPLSLTLHPGIQLTLASRILGGRGRHCGHPTECAHKRVELLDAGNPYRSQRRGWAVAVNRTILCRRVRIFIFEFTYEFWNSCTKCLHRSDLSGPVHPHPLRLCAACVGNVWAIEAYRSIGFHVASIA